MASDSILLWLISVCLLAAPLAAEESSTTTGTEFSSPEGVRIVSINDQARAEHPPAIDVLPGDHIRLRADVLQFGNACPHPEGCPEGKSPEEFLWTADDRADDSCRGAAEDCRDRTEFEPVGSDMIFHIPYTMSSDIRIHVRHDGMASEDTLVLHNQHLPVSASDSHAPYATTPPDFYADDRDNKPLYPALAPNGVNEPYCSPYYPGPYCYPYYGGVWWGWGGPHWVVGWGWGYGPGWWAWPHYYGWYGYHPGLYGYYHPGWWSVRSTLMVGPRLRTMGAPRPMQAKPWAFSALPPAFHRPVFHAAPPPAYRMPRFGHRRWR